MRLTTIALASSAALACAGPRAASSRGEAPAGSSLQAGQAALKEGRPDDAIALFRRALAQRPEPAAMRGLVEAHFRSERGNAVVAELEPAAASRPRDALVHYGLGLAYFAQGAAAEPRAAEELARACELEPQVAEYHFRLGVLSLESERYSQAAASLSRARELDPTPARHYVPLAMALARLGDRAGALSAVRGMLNRSPEERDLDIARRVVARITDAFREFPKSVENDFQRGLEYLEKHDAPQQAIVAFEEILERFPDLAVVHAALGLCFQRLDDSGRAMDELSRALELAPEDPRNHLYLADLYFGRERFDRAIEGYRAAIARDPLSDRAYERLGEIALQRGDAPEAVANLKAVVLLRPSDLGARQRYALALLAQGELDEAERELTGIAEKDPRNAEVQLRLGVLNADRQKREKDPARAKSYGARAARHLERVLDLQPQNAFAAKLLQSVKP